MSSMTLISVIAIVVLTGCYPYFWKAAGIVVEEVVEDVVENIVEKEISQDKKDI